MIRADASSLRKLGSALRKSRPDVYKALRRAVLKEGRIIADDAKERASWSSRIPETIKPSMQGVGTVVVRAGGGKAPHAAAYEHAGKQGTFRHPVFGDAAKERKDWTWVSEDARPFLHPAALDRLETTVQNLRDAVQDAISTVIEEE